MKRILAWIVIVIVMLGALIPGSLPVGADDIDDLKDKVNGLEGEKDSIADERDNLSSEKEATENKIAENKARQDQTTSELEQIDRNLEATQNQLTAKENEITETNEEIELTTEEIEQLKIEIEELKERIAKREELLKNRLRALQQSGGNISYLEVLMGAQSFGDFINRATAVTKIMDQDKGIMETHKLDKQELEDGQNELEEKQASLEQRKQDLEDQKQELETLKAELNRQAEEKERLMAQLEQEHTELVDYELSLAEEQEVLRKEAAALEKAIEQAQNEQKRLEQLAAQQEKGDSSSTPPKAGGNLFGWPAAATYVSSEFNPNRMHPIYKVPRPHTGMDIASSGTVPIYAAASGVVSTVYHNDSIYGNAVFITHYLNNQEYTTAYFHMRNGSLAVSEGQTVTKGQQIGLMGSTGASTGQHLHFEIRVGGSARGNAVNPRPYLFQ